MSELWNKLFSDAAVKQKASPIREIMSVIRQPGMISFAGGMPDPEIFPVKEFYDSAEIIKREGKDILQYGNTDGYAPLKEFLSEWTQERMGRKVSSREMLITSGSIQVADLLTFSTIDKGDYIVTESPTFLGTTLDMYNHGARFICIPCDHQGMLVDLIPEKVEKARAKGKKVKYIYTIPNFQNPVGCTLSMERRKKLLQVAEELELAILEDDPYGYIRFDGEDLPPLFSMDNKGIVVFGGSFSKILAPGTRVGWCFGDPDIIRKMTVFKQGVDTSTSVISQALVYEYCRKGYLDALLPKIIDHYRKKRDVMETAFRKYLPQGEVEYNAPEGGFFYWMKTAGIPTDELFNKSIEKKVAFVKGEPFFPEGGGDHEFRMCYTFASFEMIDEGVKRLGEAMRELL
ncbi:MAG: PLP-dependent aminotransferase family protein [Synergistales bacterium]|nr:PLP-dependent aminotransferase family protein [Synergistales bacterium]